MKKISTATQLQVASCVSKKINFILCGNSVATVVTRRVTSKMIDTATRFVDHRRPSADIKTQTSDVRSVLASGRQVGEGGRQIGRSPPSPTAPDHQILDPQNPGFGVPGARGPGARGTRGARGAVFPGPGGLLPPAAPSRSPGSAKMAVFEGFPHISPTYSPRNRVYGYIQGPRVGDLGGEGGPRCPELENY